MTRHVSILEGATSKHVSYKMDTCHVMAPSSALEHWR